MCINYFTPQFQRMENKLSFKESEKALKILIEGETSASASYLIFSNKAEEEGFPVIGALFNALSTAEKIHIKNHKRALGENYSPEAEDTIINSTIDNLKHAIEGETEENRKLYPSLIKKIKKETKTEKGKVARLTMVWAQKAEAEHAKLLKQAYKAIKSSSDLKVEQIYICRVCGNIILNSNNEKECTVCGHDFLFFDKAVS